MVAQQPFMVVVSPNTSSKVFVKVWGRTRYLLALSLCLIHMIHHFDFLNHISSEILLSSTILVGFIYMDDCDLFILAPPSNLNPQAVLQTLQHNMDIWQGGLEATSGMLSWAKCSWSSLFYHFKAGW